MSLLSDIVEVALLGARVSYRTTGIYNCMLALGHLSVYHAGFLVSLAETRLLSGIIEVWGCVALRRSTCLINEWNHPFYNM